MMHPKQRELWYSGCLPHILIGLVIVILIGNLI